MKKTGVIIARFQTPYLHPGHRNLIDFVSQKHRKTVIVLGVTPILGSKRNPFDFFTREKLLKEAYPGLVVIPHSDHPSDRKWSLQLDELLRNTFPNEDFLLYGGRDSFIKSYSGKFATEAFPQLGGFSATDIRNELSDEVRGSEDFRAGINYAYHNTYPKVYPTVDVALFRNDRTEILLGKKVTLDQWRLIGGFTDPTDNCYEDAALRELQEECGKVEVGPMQYVGSFRVDDWRYRSEEDKIMTLLYATDYLFGTPQAQDDIVDVSWIPVADLPNMLQSRALVSEHRPLFERIIQYLQ